MARVAPEKAAFRPALPLGFLPGVNGTHMGKMTYGEQLKHPNWQRKRLEVLEGAGFECENCGDKESTLHVHHSRYVKGRMAWEYEQHELQALCETCHAQHHEHREILDDLLSVGISRLQIAIGLLAGYESANMNTDEHEAAHGLRIGGLAFYSGAMAAMLENDPAGAADAVATFRAGILNPSEQNLLEQIRGVFGPARD